MKKALEENEREEEEMKKSYEEKLAAAKLNVSILPKKFISGEIGWLKKF